MKTPKISSAILKKLYIPLLVTLTIFFSSCENYNDVRFYSGVGHSTDNGETWTVYNSLFHNIRNLESMDSGKTITAVSDNSIIRSSNNGFSFSTINTDASFIIPTGVVNCGIMIKHREGIYHTSDNGANFNLVYSTARTNFFGGDFDSHSGLGIVLGEKTLFKSTNYGLSWDTIPGLSQEFNGNEVFGVDVVNSQLIYVLCQMRNAMFSSFLLKTTNAGVNWSKTVVSDTAINEYYYVSFFNENIGIATGHLHNGRMSKTTDGGNNWIECGPRFNEVFFSVTISGNTYLAINGKNVFRSSDFGDTWEIFESEGITHLSNLYSPAPGDLYVSGFVRPPGITPVD